MLGNIMEIAGIGALALPVTPILLALLSRYGSTMGRLSNSGSETREIVLRLQVLPDPQVAATARGADPQRHDMTSEVEA